MIQQIADAVDDHLRTRKVELGVMVQFVLKRCRRRMKRMAQRMTVAEYKRVSKSRKSKYGNRKVELDGQTFDSLAESRYYKQLKWLEEHKEILFFRLQPRYMLQEAFEKDGKKHRRIDYIADFEIHHLDGSIEVVDVKGALTDVFRIKEKMFNKKYPHKLTLVKYKNGRFEEVT